MLLLVACVFLITKGSIDYDDLVADVENTFDECLGIVEDVWSYVEEVYLLQEVRRRVEDENDNDATEVKLGACASMLKLVDTYRENHSRLVLYHDLLRLEEKSYLHELLKPLSKKMGDVLYIASKDGDDILDFRTACGNLSPTLIIVESTNGTVFGGYTDVDWSSTGQWWSSSSPFLFRLRPSFAHYAITNTQYANWVTDSVIRFGSDLRIVDSALSNADSTVGAHSYDLDGYELNDGEQYFQAKEYIAVKVEDL